MNKIYPSKYVSIIRLYNSHVLNPADNLNVVVHSLFGVQSQIFNASAVALYVRMKKIFISDIKEKLKTMEFVRLWGQRTTIHIYCKEDWPLLLSFLSTTINWYTLMIKKSEKNIEELTASALKVIYDKPYFSRKDLIAEGIDPADIGAWGDLLIELSNRGYIYHYFNPEKNEKLFGNTQTIFGHKIQTPSFSLELKEEIILRFFRAYAPATVKDFSHWIGITLNEAKEYFSLVQDKLLLVQCEDKEYYIEKKSNEKYEQIFKQYINDSKYILLPKFDPLLLAYSDKTWITEKNNWEKIWKKAGHVEGVILQYGRAIATWRYLLKSKDIHFEVYPIEKSVSLDEIQKNFNDFAAFFGRPLGKITIMGEQC